MDDLLTEGSTDTREPSTNSIEATRKVATQLDTLFSDMGGPAAIGRIIGVSTEHAAAMKRRGAIPLTHWPNIVMSNLGKALGITETRLLFAHTGVATGRVPAAPPPVPKDDEDKVRWTSRDPDLLFNLQPATRVYRNAFEQVVICQEPRDVDDDEPFVFFEATNIPKLIVALQREMRRD